VSVWYKIYTMEFEFDLAKRRDVHSQENLRLFDRLARQV